MPIPLMALAALAGGGALIGGYLGQQDEKNQRQALKGQALQSKHGWATRQAPQYGTFKPQTGPMAAQGALSGTETFLKMLAMEQMFGGGKGTPAGLELKGQDLYGGQSPGTPSISAGGGPLALGGSPATTGNYYAPRNYSL